MSDAAIINVATALVSVVTTIATFLTLWVKLKYGIRQNDDIAQKTGILGKKIDANTMLTAKAKNAAEQAEKQTNGTFSQFVEQVSDHAERIKAIEEKVLAIKLTLDANVKGIDSTRHEIRGALQTLTTKLDLLTMSASMGRSPTPPTTPSPPATDDEGSK